MMHTIPINTRQREEMIDITAPIAALIRKEQWEAGILFIHTPHTTAAVTINENADPSVTADMIGFMRRQIPQDPHFRHSEGNSDSHIKSSLFGCQLWLLVESGKPVLGTWQGVYFCEWDGPRQRQVHVKFLKEMS